MEANAASYAPFTMMGSWAAIPMLEARSSQMGTFLVYTKHFVAARQVRLDGANSCILCRQLHRGRPEGTTIFKNDVNFLSWLRQLYEFNQRAGHPYPGVIVLADVRGDCWRCDRLGS